MAGLRYPDYRTLERGGYRSARDYYRPLDKNGNPVPWTEAELKKNEEDVRKWMNDIGMTRAS